MSVIYVLSKEMDLGRHTLSKVRSLLITSKSFKMDTDKIIIDGNKADMSASLGLRQECSSEIIHLIDVRLNVKFPSI